MSAKNGAVMLWGGFYANVSAPTGQNPRGFDKIEEIQSALLGYIFRQSKGKLCDVLTQPRSLDPGAVEQLVKDLREFNSNRLLILVGDVLKRWDATPAGKALGDWERALRATLNRIQMKPPIDNMADPKAKHCGPCKHKPNFGDISIGEDGNVSFPMGVILE